MARRKDYFEKDLKKLITKLSGFEESEENFELSWQFSESNVIHHRFLSVDSHKVTRSIEGLVAKFEINAEYERAELLPVLIEKFLDNRLTEKCHRTRTDTHYGLLQVLLCLANSPINAEYVKPVPKPEEVAEKPFDWAAYLLEGEETCRSFCSKSPDTSEDDDEESDSESSNQSEEKVVRFDDDPPVEDSVPTQQGGDNSTLETVPSELKSVLEKGDNWLERNVMVQYWHGVVENGVWANDNCSNFYTDWECYQWRTDPLCPVKQNMKITETQMIRELIWMLSGVKELFICRYQNGRFCLREDLALSHLTKESLLQRLEIFLKHAEQVQQLQDFITGNTNQKNCYKKSHDQTPLTYQAFAGCLSQFLQKFKACLSRLEIVVSKQEEKFTFHNFGTVLEPWLIKLGVVYDMYCHGIEEVKSMGDNSVLTSTLLTHIYNTVLKYSDLSQPPTDLASLLLSMLVQTSQPYLNLMDEWISRGTLTDPRKEFLIQRNKSVKSLDEKFWQTAFYLISPTPTTSKSNAEVTSLGRRGSGQSREQPRESSYLAPKFLKPVLKEVVLAGKSMELLQNLGCLRQVMKDSSKGGSEGKSWHATFVDSLEKALGKTSLPTPAETSSGDDSGGEITQSDLPSWKNVLSDIKDPVLRSNFSAIFDPEDLKNNSGASKTYNHDNTNVPELSASNLQPVRLLFEQCLYPYVHRRYQMVCLKLVEILTLDYHLLDYLDSMRRFYLMEAGDAMFDFYTGLFQKVQTLELWRDVYSLNALLDVSLQTHYPDDAYRLFFEISEASYKPKDSNPINAFDRLKLNYRVPWPVDIIINSDAQKIYNRVFVFLLQIKYAKCSLDGLLFTDLERETLRRTIVEPEDAFSHYGKVEDDDEKAEEQIPRGHRVHRMQLLKMSLLNFVNSLHTYIMTRILHSTGLEFMSEIKKAADLDQIIALHSGYVLRIHDRCLLHKDVAFLKETVLKVLNLCVIYGTRWKRGIDEISSESLESLETEFGKYMQFLSSFLNNVVKRGSFPHLEPLAFALINSLDQ